MLMLYGRHPDMYTDMYIYILHVCVVRVYAYIAQKKAAVRDGGVELQLLYTKEEIRVSFIASQRSAAVSLRFLS